MADDSITACGEVRLETRAQEPHAPPVEPPQVPVAARCSGAAYAPARATARQSRRTCDQDRRSTKRH